MQGVGDRTNLHYKSILNLFNMCLFVCPSFIPHKAMDQQDFLHKGFGQRLCIWVSIGRVLVKNPVGRVLVKTSTGLWSGSIYNRAMIKNL